MNVEIKLNKNLKEAKIIICCNEITDEINNLIKSLSQKNLSTIVGIKNNKWEILEPLNIITIYSSEKKVFAKTEKGEYVLKNRLYELEDMLDKTMFVRISNSEIINLKNVINLELSFNGIVCINLKTGIKTYTSRRYVNKIKKY